MKRRNGRKAPKTVKRAVCKLEALAMELGKKRLAMHVVDLRTVWDDPQYFAFAFLDLAKVARKSVDECAMRFGHSGYSEQSLAENMRRTVAIMTDYADALLALARAAEVARIKKGPGA